MGKKQKNVFEDKREDEIKRLWSDEEIKKLWSDEEILKKWSEKDIIKEWNWVNEPRVNPEKSDFSESELIEEKYVKIEFFKSVL